MTGVKRVAAGLLISFLTLPHPPVMAADARTSLDPFRSTCDISSSTSVSLGRCAFSNTLPEGKRLVLETVTGAYSGDSEILGAAYLTVEGVRYVFPWVQAGRAFSLESDPLSLARARGFYGFNHYVQIYVDGPATLQMDAAGGASLGGSSSYSGWYSLSGYLVDLPKP